MFRWKNILFSEKQRNYSGSLRGFEFVIRNFDVKVQWNEVT
jgi:hypothetical protein